MLHVKFENHDAAVSKNKSFDLNARVYVNYARANVKFFFHYYVSGKKDSTYIPCENSAKSTKPFWSKS